MRIPLDKKYRLDSLAGCDALAKDVGRALKRGPEDLVFADVAMGQLEFSAGFREAAGDGIDKVLMVLKPGAYDADQAYLIFANQEARRHPKGMSDLVGKRMRKKTLSPRIDDTNGLRFSYEARGEPIGRIAPAGGHLSAYGLLLADDYASAANIAIDLTRSYLLAAHDFLEASADRQERGERAARRVVDSYRPK